MIEIRDHIQCCGINELTPITDNTNNPKQTIKDACYQIYERGEKGAFVFFSDTGKKKAGINLKNFILENNLGTITESKSMINPNSRHKLQMWIWELNKRNLKNFWLNNKIENNYN